MNESPPRREVEAGWWCRVECGVEVARVHGLGREKAVWAIRAGQPTSDGLDEPRSSRISELHQNEVRHDLRDPLLAFSHEVQMRYRNWVQAQFSVDELLPFRNKADFRGRACSGIFHRGHDVHVSDVLFGFVAGVRILSDGDGVSDGVPQRSGLRQIRAESLVIFVLILLANEFI